MGLSFPKFLGGYRTTQKSERTVQEKIKNIVSSFFCCAIRILRAITSQSNSFKELAPLEPSKKGGKGVRSGSDRGSVKGGQKMTIIITDLLSIPSNPLCPPPFLGGFSASSPLKLCEVINNP